MTLANLKVGVNSFSLNYKRGFNFVFAYETQFGEGYKTPNLYYTPYFDDPLPYFGVISHPCLFTRLNAGRNRACIRSRSLKKGNFKSGVKLYTDNKNKFNSCHV